MHRISKFSREVYQKIYNALVPLDSFVVYAFILLLVMFAAYNLMIKNIGFYYDDWEGVFLQKQNYSFLQVWNYFLIDRPFSALVHFVLNPLLGTKPASWRIAGMLVNWTAVLFIVKSLLRIWPKRIMEIGWIGLMLAVYPGITRQFVIRTSMVHYISLLLFSISIWLMIKAVQELKHRWVFLAISLILSILQMLIIEYFAGLELIRGLILFYIFKKEGKTTGKALKDTFYTWFPFLFGFAIFIIFRFSILPGIQQAGMVTKNTPGVFTALLSNPLQSIIYLMEVILQDVVYAVLYVWSQTIVPEQIDLQAMATLASWVVGALMALFAGVTISIWQQKSGDEESAEPYPLFIFLLCIFAMLLGGLPIWAVGRQVIKGLWASRFLFGLVMGAVPSVVLALSWAFSKHRRKMYSIVLSLLLMSSIAFQFRTGKTFALTWHYTRDYFWQLKWRAPSLVPGTFILSPYTPYQFSADYEIAFTTNIFFDAGNQSENVSYWWFDGPDDLLDFSKNAYPDQLVIDHKFRNISFQSDLQHALAVIYKPSRGCLQVLDTAYVNEPLLLPVEQQLFPVLNTGLILNDSTPVPLDIFGPEPDRTWCYFYQSADRARSNENWPEVIKQWDIAKQEGLKTAYGPEYLPFIEANARLTQWDDALEFTEMAMATTEKMEPFLCTNWERIKTSTPDSQEKSDVINSVMDLLKCSELSESFQ
ncbi:MAG: hypothetical protein CVU46_06550 [Chloroflexi bacterium HGW-Chloroflexi-8]|nr:MAG: hypothetical protein CVU46_06550 [Chloroflexi bacterium HGW-Chloroflexi-8]